MSQVRRVARLQSLPINLNIAKQAQTNSVAVLEAKMRPHPPARARDCEVAALNANLSPVARAHDCGREVTGINRESTKLGNERGPHPEDIAALDKSHLRLNGGF